MDVDLFRFEVANSGNVRAFTTGGIDTVLRLFDAAGTEIAFNDDFNGLLSELSVELLPGVYYTGVSSYPNFSYDPTVLDNTRVEGFTTGEYGLQLEVTPGDVNGTIPTAVSLENDLGFQLADLTTLTTVAPGSIGSDLGGNSGDNDVDIFSFNVPTGGGLVTIQTDEGLDPSDPVDSILRLFDDNGQELAFDDDGGNGLFSRLEASLDAGTYFAGVSGFANFGYNPFSSSSGNPGSTGSYALQFQFQGGNFAGGDPNGTIENAFDFGNLGTLDLDGDGNPDDLTIGFGIGVVLGSDPVPDLTDRLAVGPRDVDLARFELPSAGTIIVETNDFSILNDPITGERGQIPVGTSIVDVDLDNDGRIDARNDLGGLPDTILRLFNAQGQEIAFNDDGGDGLFSRIEADLEAGVYYVGISGFNTGFYDPAVVDDLRIEGSTGVATVDFVFQAAGSNSLDPNGIRRGANPVNLILGGTTRFSGDIGLDGDLEVTDVDVDLYEFTAPSDGILLIDIDTPYGPEFGNTQVNADTVIRMFDVNGVELARSDDSLALNFAGELVEFDTDGDPANFSNSIVENEFGEPVGHDLDSFVGGGVLAGETFFIGVSGFGNSDYNIDNFDDRIPSNQFITGGSAYDLIVSYGGASAGADVDGVINTAAAPIVLPFSEPAGNIGDDDGTAVGPADVDFYRVTADSAGILNVDIDAFEGDAVADPVDSMLFIFDPQGNELAFNDDSAGDSTEAGTLDARLQLNVQPGDYYIAVTGFGNFDFDPNIAGSGSGGDTGNYRLNVDLSPAGSGSDDERARLPVFLTEGTDSSLDLDLNIFELFNDQGVLELPFGVSSFTLGSGSPIFISGNLGQDTNAASDDTVTEPERPAVRNAFGPVFLSESGGVADTDVSVTVGDDDVDLYPITIATAGTYDLDLVNITGQLADFGANATLLLFDNTGQEVARSSTESRLIQTLDPGDYLLAVVPEGGADSFNALTQTFEPNADQLQSFSQNTGDYTLRLQEFALENNNETQTNLGAFSLPLNSALQLEPLSLYDGPDSGDGFDGASVIVTDPNGDPVPGSIVFDEATNQVIFIPTTPQSSGSFQITYDGSDFVAAAAPVTLATDPSGTVDISMGATMITVPNFARGPGQAVDIRGAGLPISINDGLGIRAIDGTGSLTGDKTTQTLA